MFDMQRALAGWRVVLSRDDRLTADEVAELEDHLMESMQEVCSASLTDEERFVVATHRLGHPVDLQREYEKVAPWATWRVPMFWAAVGVAWALGIEAILDTAIPMGALLLTHLGLPMGILSAWVFVVYAGGPVIAFASVAAWMRRNSALHPKSTRALQTTLIAAALLRVASLPLARLLNSSAWKGFDPRSWQAFQSTWQAALLLGWCVVAGLGALVLVRFRAHSARDAAST